MGLIVLRQGALPPIYDDVTGSRLDNMGKEEPPHVDVCDTVKNRVHFRCFEVVQAKGFSGLEVGSRHALLLASGRQWQGNAASLPKIIVRYH